MPQSPDIGQNSDGGISDFRISGHSLIKENCYNSRTSDDIDMKLGPVTKIDRETKQHQKNLRMTSCWIIVTLFLFFGFLANLEPSGGRIPGTESAEVMFSVTITFYLTKTENRTKKFLTQLSHYCFD